MVNLLEAIDHRMSPGSHAVMLQLYFEPQINLILIPDHQASNLLSNPIALS